MPAPRAAARVRVHGLQTKTEFNNCLGTVKGAVDGGRFCVLLDGEAGRELSLKPENFSLEAEEGKVVAAVAEEEAVEPEGPLAPKPLPKPLPSLPSSTLPAHPLPAAGEEEEEEEEVVVVVLDSRGDRGHEKLYIYIREYIYIFVCTYLYVYVYINVLVCVCMNGRRGASCRCVCVHGCVCMFAWGKESRSWSRASVVDAASLTPTEN